MIKFISKHTSSLAIPSLLIGLSASGLVPYYPEISKWIGIVSLICLAIVIFIYFIARITNKIIPRRFANSVYVLDEANNLAVILHPHYKRYIPPGSRLGYLEAPHEAIYRVMEEELGLKNNDYSIVSEDKTLPKYRKSYIVPKPFIVKIETGVHRAGVTEHYDFVYICFVSGVKPELRSPINPKWLNLDELKDFSINNIENAPFEDVVPIYESILIKKESFTRH